MSFPVRQDGLDLRSNDDGRKGPEPKILPDEKCAVCGGKATGFNYRVVSCNACKAFFRRSVTSGKRYPCRFEGMPVRSSTAADRAQLLSICQHCRLAKCRQAGMRDEYVHNLRFGRIERKSKKLLGNGNFRSVLDPGQTNLLDLFQTFWRIYRNFSNIAQSPGVLTPGQMRKMSQLDRFEAQLTQIERPEVPAPTPGDKLSYINYIKNVLTVHVKIADKLLEFIPEFKTISPETRHYCMRFGSLEMSMARGACNRSLAMESDDDTKKLSITGKGLTTDHLKDLGMTSGLVDGMMEVTQSMRGYKGDEIEWALVGGICLFNMDRDSPAFKPTYEEKTQIETIQETLLLILKIKLRHEGKPLKYLASYIEFVTKTHNFANKSISEWGKFFHYRPKFYFAGATGENSSADAPASPCFT